MQKIISLFKRNYEKTPLTINDLVIPAHQVYNEVVPGAEWVLAGEGTATRKWDGTCCKIEGGQFYKRYDAKNGKKPPEDFIPAQDADPVTGHWPGWLKVNDTAKEDKWFREGYANTFDADHGAADGTWELIGPAINGNPEEVREHILVKHGLEIMEDAPRTFDELREWFKTQDIEGIVWHHPDGRMVKIKKSDLGLKRKELCTQ